MVLEIVKSERKDDFGNPYWNLLVDGKQVTADTYYFPAWGRAQSIMRDNPHIHFEVKGRRF